MSHSKLERKPGFKILIIRRYEKKKVYLAYRAKREINLVKDHKDLYLFNLEAAAFSTFKRH